MYAKRLKQIRKSLRYKADEMAEQLGIKTRTYGSYERNENMPPIEFATLICNKFNVNGNWFLTGMGEMFINSETKDKLEEKIGKIVEIKLKERGL